MFIRDLWILDPAVMLYQEHNKRFQLRWRGLFQIASNGGAHGLSFKLQQLNGRRIRGAIHDEHLKRFVSRTGYLKKADSTPPLPYFQALY